MIDYIDPPTIPEGMTCAEYRRARQHHCRHPFLRLVRALYRHN
jgi:hypothetical protein